jgi:hypothetical protein
MKYWTGSLKEIPEIWSKGFLEGTETGRELWGDFAEYTKDTFELTGVYLQAFAEATGDNIQDLWGAVKQQFEADLDYLIGMLADRFPQFTDLLNKYRDEVVAGVPAGEPKPEEEPYTPHGSLSNLEIGLRNYYQSIDKWNTFVQDSTKRTANNIEQSFADTFTHIGDEGNNFKSVMNDIFRSIGEEVRGLMGQLAGRIFMKTTIEHIFPDLVKPDITDMLDTSSAQLTQAGIQLNSSGVQLQSAAMALQAAAAQQAASSAASQGASGSSILAALGGGGAGGTTWAGTNATPGFSAPTPTGTYIAHGGGRFGFNSFPQTQVDSSLFTHAPRLHNGLKLKSDEFPAILEIGEEVKSRREVAADRSQAKQPIVNDNRMRIVNVLDPSIVRDYLRSPDGEKVIINTIRRGQRSS